MTNEEKDKTIKKWSELGLIEGLTNNRITQLTENELEEYCKNQPQPNYDYNFNDFQTLLPTAIKISSKTIAGGGWTKSKKQQLKEDRINKLRKIQGLKPNVILENDKWEDGLVTVQPLSAPNPNLYYADFKYNSDENK